MTEPLELMTDRLRLRTPQIEDADAIQSIVEDSRVALTTASIPHPYPAHGAKGFIRHVRNVASRDRRNLAIVLRDGGELIGMIGYVSDGVDAELAYMVPLFIGDAAMPAKLAGGLSRMSSRQHRPQPSLRARWLTTRPLRLCCARPVYDGSLKRPSRLPSGPELS